MASSAGNKKLQVAAADVKPACQVPNKVTACVQQILHLKVENQRELLAPDCCKELTEQFGCACVLRNALKEANLLDIQKPFCVKGTACE